MKIRTKSILLISASTSSAFLIYALYKGIILYFINEALEDTFVGGSTSNISIILWFIISGILMLITSMFLFFLKIKDLKSQKIILTGIFTGWTSICIVLIIVTPGSYYFIALTGISALITLISSRILVKKIQDEKHELTEKEIYLLQQLAKKK